MGCRGCDEAEALRKANRVAEAAADGALGVLAGVQNLLTERAIDPTPFGQKEEETLSAIAQLIKKYVEQGVSRETEAADVPEEEMVPATERDPHVQDSRAKDSQVNRASANRLGVRLQSDGHFRLDGMPVSRRTLAAGERARNRAAVLQHVEPHGDDVRPAVGPVRRRR